MGSNLSSLRKDKQSKEKIAGVYAPKECEYFFALVIEHKSRTDSAFVVYANTTQQPIIDFISSSAFREIIDKCANFEYNIQKVQKKGSKIMIKTRQGISHQFRSSLWKDFSRLFETYDFESFNNKTLKIFNSNLK